MSGRWCWHTGGRWPPPLGPYGSILTLDARRKEASRAGPVLQMSVVWFWFRASLRARARSYVGVAVLLALLGGLTLATFAGARRTASAYDRFRAAGEALDVQVNAGGFEVEFPERAGQMPGVTASLLTWRS